MDKYIVYSNDLKSNKNNINPELAIWDNNSTKALYKNLSYNTIQYRIDECKKNNYSYLDLSDMGLKEIILTPDQIGQLIGIKYLFVNNNSLTSIDVSMFKSLEVLDVSNNIITILDNLPPNLIELCCTHNQITQIAPHDKLVRLDCSFNKLVNLSQYKNLQILKCTHNQIDKIIGYGSMTTLYCGNNPINEIHGLKLLHTLNCSNTDIINIDSLTKIKILICSKSKITNLNNDLPLEYLEIINTPINKLEYYPKLKDFVYDSNNNISLSSKYKIKNYYKQQTNRIVEFVVI